MLSIKAFTVNPLSENCYVVSDETHEAVIIDCGAMYDEEREAIANYLEQNHLKPVAHLLTHAHFDHIFGGGFIFKRYGLAARCHTNEVPLFEHAEEQMRSILGHALPFEKGPTGEAISEDCPINFGNHTFTVLPCPGHTAGGVCYYCAEEHVLFSGDNLFQMSIGRTDFPGGDHWTLIRSLRHLLSDLPDGVTVYPGHGPTTETAFERAHNPYLQL